MMEPSSMSIETLKGIILTLMFVVTFICSMIPVFFINHIHNTHDATRRNKYQTLLSFLSCAAGGVFMGTCILDLFPDVQEQVDKVMVQFVFSRPFPVAEFIVVFGFLLVLTMEQIVLDYKERSLLVTITQGESQALLQDPDQVRETVRREHSITGISDRPDLTSSLVSLRTDCGSHSGLDQGNSSYGAISCEPTDGHEHTDIFDHSIHKDISSHSSLRSFMLLFALSLHSVFEGMAVGLQSSIDNVLGLFMVVIFHKGVIALSLSLNMVQSRLTLKQIMLANLVFCTTAPIGLAIGMGIMEMKETLTTALLSGVLQGIACGTFLYVTFFEVLPHEMNTGDHRLLKLLCIILGFSLVCGMLYINPENSKYKCYMQSG